MNIISRSELETHPDGLPRIAEEIENGQLICLPTRSGYKLVTRLDSKPAVTALQQAKRRIRNAPSLVVVSTPEQISPLTEEVPDTAAALMRHFWPGPLTLLLKPTENMDSGLRRILAKSSGRIGFRLTDDEPTASVVRAFGRPVLVSSANLSRKNGFLSVAQVKRNFGRFVSTLVDCGDIAGPVSSTLVDVTDGTVRIVREGAIRQDTIHATLTAADSSPSFP